MNHQLRKVKKIINRGAERFFKIRRRTLKLGFIGCGRHAQESLYPSLRFTPFELIATCAHHLENAERVGKQFGAEKFYDDYQKMINREKLDALIVSINPQMHYEIGLYAAKKHLPVFVEKPPAPTAKLAGEMNQGIVMVGFQKRFAPAYKKAKEIINSREFGQPHLFNASFCVGETGSEKQLIFDTGIHFIDLIRFFLGEIESLSSKKAKRGNLASITLLLKMKNGAVGSLILSDRFSWPKMSERIEIYGEESRVVVDNLHTLYYDRPTIASPGLPPSQGELSLVWRPSYPVGVVTNQSLFLNGYAYELIHFAEVVAGRLKVESSITEGRKALEIIEKILHG